MNHTTIILEAVVLIATLVPDSGGPLAMWKGTVANNATGVQKEFCMSPYEFNAMLSIATHPEGTPLHSDGTITTRQRGC